MSSNSIQQQNEQYISSQIKNPEVQSLLFKNLNPRQESDDKKTRIEKLHRIYGTHLQQALEKLDKPIKKELEDKLKQVIFDISCHVCNGDTKNDELIIGAITVKSNKKDFTKFSLIAQKNDSTQKVKQYLTTQYPSTSFPCLIESRSQQTYNRMANPKFIKDTTDMVENCLLTLITLSINEPNEETGLESICKRTCLEKEIVSTLRQQPNKDNLQNLNKLTKEYSECIENINTLINQTINLSKEIGCDIENGKDAALDNLRMVKEICVNPQEKINIEARYKRMEEAVTRNSRKIKHAKNSYEEMLSNLSQIKSSGEYKAYKTFEQSLIQIEINKQEAEKLLQQERREQIKSQKEMEHQEREERAREQALHNKPIYEDMQSLSLASQENEELQHLKQRALLDGNRTLNQPLQLQEGAGCAKEKEKIVLNRTNQKHENVEYIINKKNQTVIKKINDEETKHDYTCLEVKHLGGNTKQSHFVIVNNTKKAEELKVLNEVSELRLLGERDIGNDGLKIVDVKTSYIKIRRDKADAAGISKLRVECEIEHYDDAVIHKVKKLATKDETQNFWITK